MYKLKKGGVLLYNVVAKNEVLEDEPDFGMSLEISYVRFEPDWFTKVEFVTCIMNGSIYFAGSVKSRIRIFNNCVFDQMLFIVKNFTPHTKHN